MKKIHFALLFFCFSYSLFASVLETNEDANEFLSSKIENQQIHAYKKVFFSLDKSHRLKQIQDKETEYTTLTLDGYENESVEKFRQLFLQKRYNTLLCESLENAVEYRIYVRKLLADEGLPPELEYLPVVESYYKPSARSKSGAVGIWQFMTNSVKPYLTVNDYVDERLDPWYETYAAIKKLQENYKTFGDWLIAIAAYNCGAGAMTRALAKTTEKDFWSLCKNNLIPKQTQDYVPKLLAIADLAINSTYYKTNIPLHQEEYESLINERNGLFDYITVKRPYSLKQLANALRIDQDILKRLNPSFKEGFTHPTHESKIRLPLGMEEAALEALKTIEPLDIPIKYKVVKGDTLWGIAKKYGTTVKAICDLNNISEKSVLSIGKILYIPSKISR